MITFITHEIEHNPEPEDAGTIKFGVCITKKYQSSHWDLYEEVFIQSSSIPISLREPIDVELITELLTVSGDITPIDAYKAILDLFQLVGEVTSSDDYTPDCALRVWMTLTIVFPSDLIEEDVIFDIDHQIEEAARSQMEELVRVSFIEAFEEDLGLEDEHDIIFDFVHRIEGVVGVSLIETTEEEILILGLEDEHDIIFDFDRQIEEAAPSQLDEFIPVYFNETIEDEVIFDFDHQIEEVLRVSFNETNTVGLRPASKLAVGSLNRQIYKKTSEAVGEIACTICLEEFSDGRSIVTLPCGHLFDDECVVEWFLSSHVCPLCRFELPCER